MTRVTGGDDTSRFVAGEFGIVVEGFFDPPELFFVFGDGFAFFNGQQFNDLVVVGTDFGGNKMKGGSPLICRNPSPGHERSVGCIHSGEGIGFGTTRGIADNFFCRRVDDVDPFCAFA